MRPLLLLLLAAPAAAQTAATVVFPDAVELPAQAVHNDGERDTLIGNGRMLDDGKGILLVYPAPRITVDLTDIPQNLDVVFLGKDGMVQDVEPNLAAAPSTLRGRGPYALLLVDGQAAAHGLVAGAQVRLLMKDPVKPKHDQRAQMEGNTSTTRQLLAAIEQVRDRLPAALYLQLRATAEKVAAEIDAHPEEAASPAAIAKRILGIDGQKLTARSEEMRKEHPEMSEAEVDRRLARELLFQQGGVPSGGGADDADKLIGGDKSLRKLPEGVRR